MENTRMQSIKENTRFQGNDEPSRLILVFTKEPEIVKKVSYKIPLGRSDHMVIEFTMNDKREVRRGEDHKIGRYNYSKANFAYLRKHFEEADWSKLYRAGTVEKKWLSLLEIYNEGIRQYVPKMGKREIGNKI